MSDLTFVLLPGAGGSAWYWHRVVPELRRHGHDAIAVDLPAADDAAGLGEYADAAVDAISRQGVHGEHQKIILVAQSMAGFFAPLVCKRVPVSMLVLMNAMIPQPGETPGEWWANTGQPEAMRQNDEREGRSATAEFDLLNYFFHDVPQPVTDYALAHEIRQSETVFGSRLVVTAWPEVATRVLVGRDDRFFPVAFQRRVAEQRLGIVPDEIAGGHLVALSRPDEVARRLHDYASGL
ncbi:MAG: hypothetical protein QOH56_4465 [Pseudonocardiales bacterium]|jgi:pimeloyl-ACP methyl ester carboxylesterase|nr:hypothetical protein [Pseudonocardiales bacterium]